MCDARSSFGDMKRSSRIIYNLLQSCGRSLLRKSHALWHLYIDLPAYCVMIRLASAIATVQMYGVLRTPRG